jgi:hypothetical protein
MFCTLYFGHFDSFCRVILCGVEALIEYIKVKRQKNFGTKKLIVRKKQKDELLEKCGRLQ